MESLARIAFALRNERSVKSRVPLLKEAFKLLYRSGNNVRQALAVAQELTWGSHGRAFWDFVGATGKRGLCGSSPVRQSESCRS